MGTPDQIDAGDPWSWCDHTAPFLDTEGDEPARFRFEQVGDDHFELTDGFIYQSANTRVEVSEATLVGTDLASIPFFMAWFVPVNGRHTPAALVHDQLVQESDDDDSPAQARADADDVFIEAMIYTDVPILRRNLMFAAVVAATRWDSGWGTRLAIALWGILSLLGTVALVAGLVQGGWIWAAAAAVAPLFGAVLWGRRRYRQGVFAGYAVWFVAVPAAVTIIGYGIYWCAEQVIRIPFSRRRGSDKAPSPASYR